VSSRTLSKSDFKLARGCDAKLFFRENGYPDNRDMNPYLALLAEGGYMVEALAKAKYVDGVQLEYGRGVATTTSAPSTSSGTIGSRSSRRLCSSAGNRPASTSSRRMETPSASSR
jgi:hypothetical protein